MGSVNYGGQRIRYSYQQSATSKSFNELNYNVTPAGIHDGGVLSFVSASPGTINIDAMKIVINDVSNKVSMTVETTDTITLYTGSPDASIYIDSTHPYIVARFVWVNALNNFMDIKTVAYASILEGDIILGKCIYVGGVLQNAFDYTRRVTSSIKILDNKKDFFRVQNTEPPSNKVHILGGTIKISSGLIDISSADSPVISNTISNGRNDYIYLNNAGAILVQEGVESASPVTPDYESRLVLAEIHRAAGKNLINGSEIFQIFGEYDETNILIDQGVRTTDSPTFDGLTVDGEATFNDKIIDKNGLEVTAMQMETVVKEDTTTGLTGYTSTEIDIPFSFTPTAIQDLRIYLWVSTGDEFDPGDAGGHTLDLFSSGRGMLKLDYTSTQSKDTIVISKASVGTNKVSVRVSHNFGLGFWYYRITCTAVRTA